MKTNYSNYFFWKLERPLYELHIFRRQWPHGVSGEHHRQKLQNCIVQPVLQDLHQLQLHVITSVGDAVNFQY